MRVQSAALKAYAQEIMRACGVDEEQIQSVSDNLIWCELVGRPNFGVQRLPIHMKRVKCGVLSCPCHLEFRKVSDSIDLLDGGGGFGHHVSWHGMERAIALAKAQGVGIVGVKNSNFFGVGAYYAQQAARAGMIGLALSNSFPKVTAHGGIAPVLGTNPFAFAAPRRNGHSLLLDMATSSLAGSTVRERIETGEPLPPGLAADASGNPITDPGNVASGALLPFGGPKGYGLALFVELLSGVITGAGVSHGVASMYNNFKESGHNGHFLMALDSRAGCRWTPTSTGSSHSWKSSRLQGWYVRCSCRERLAGKPTLTTASTAFRSARKHGACSRSSRSHWE
jgi:LDH2 family malate/lactate/ureidoglycolate dehydrogenase